MNGKAKYNVAIAYTDKKYYPKVPPFFPSEKYPEYIFSEDISDENSVYDQVRTSFYLLGMDAEKFGTCEWNPLKDLISPGNTVLIKPNLVMDHNPSGDGTDCLFTHPSVVKPVIDYVIIALNGYGKIVIGDAPMQECDFNNLINTSGYKTLIDYYKNNTKCKGISFELIDFRDVTSTISSGGVYHSSLKDKSGGCIVKLNEISEFSNLKESLISKLRVTNYDPAILQEHHNSFTHEYCINWNVLSADVIINMPKPKTHRKAGVTISLKNLVGINARKEFLPHHTNGSKEEGGDEYNADSIIKSAKSHLLDIRNVFMQRYKFYFPAKAINSVLTVLNVIQRHTKCDSYFEGSWYGNKTISRTIADLNKILLYADKSGVIQKNIQRSYFIVADMIISGENEGPVMPTAKNVGIIASGYNPVCFDEMILTIMGAKINMIDTITVARSTQNDEYRLVEKGEMPFAVSNDPRWDNKSIDDITDNDKLYFEPTSGWIPAFYKRER